MSDMMWQVIGIVLCCIFIENVHGHGRMVEPPMRAAMWRFGYKTPKNYEDNELFCGGFTIQKMNGGKCGVCGDNFKLKQPRPNEAGGKFGNGIIVRNYTQGQVITVGVRITANHLGTFQFKICPNNDVKKIVEQDCLDKYALQLTDGSGTLYQVGTQRGLINVDLQLPKDLTCTQCVLQWEYRGGNNPGVCEDGTSRKGCGAQETFRNCADVAIQKA